MGCWPLLERVQGLRELPWSCQGAPWKAIVFPRKVFPREKHLALCSVLCMGGMREGLEVDTECFISRLFANFLVFKLISVSF